MLASSGSRWGERQLGRAGLSVSCLSRLSPSFLPSLGGSDGEGVRSGLPCRAEEAKAELLPEGESNPTAASGLGWRAALSLPPTLGLLAPGASFWQGRRRRAAAHLLLLWLLPSALSLSLSPSPPHTCLHVPGSSGYASAPAAFLAGVAPERSLLFPRH